MNEEERKKIIEELSKIFDTKIEEIKNKLPTSTPKDPPAPQDPPKENPPKEDPPAPQDPSKEELERIKAEFEKSKQENALLRDLIVQHNLNVRDAKKAEEEAAKKQKEDYENLKKEIMS